MTRRSVAIAWMLAALAYMAYAAATYTGLYRIAAEYQLEQYDKFDPKFTFFVLLVVLIAPTYLVDPKLWSRNRTGSRWAAVPPSPGEAARARRGARSIFGLGALAAVIGLGAGGVAMWRDSRAPVVAAVDLTSGAPAWSGEADQMVLTGFAQPRLSEVLVHTIQGNTTRTLYTPITARNWVSGQPIAYIIEGPLIGSDPAWDYSRPSSAAMRFGPATISRGDLPGLIRTAFERRGVTLDPSFVVLDPNLGHANQTLWIVCLFGAMFAMVLPGVAWLMWRAASRMVPNSRDPLQ